MILARTIETAILEVQNKMPALVITGPRQSGKTFLVKKLFPAYRYINLEFPDNRVRAQNDPRGLLEGYEEGIILDEIQHVPELLSYVQGFLDESRLMGRFIITGSQHFALLENISQSLAGRAAVFTLLPFSIAELQHAHIAEKHVNTTMVKGFYPPVHDRGLQPAQWMQDYLVNYVERDVRQLVNIKDLSKFQLLLKLCAGRTGQLLNYNALANETGMDNKTVKHWLSVLEASYIIFLLKPFYKNFNKRQVKSPKLYFYDTGLASHLLEIKTPTDIAHHFARGALFENLVIAELQKYYLNKGMNRQLYFWRDSTGNEVDCLMEESNSLHLYEIKSGQTIQPAFFKGLEFFRKIAGDVALYTWLIYGGTENFRYRDTEVRTWSSLTK